MGQASTREARSSHHGEGSSSSAPTQSWPSTVDGGFLEPQGVYTGPQDYSHDAVKTAIVNRKLMPFHKGYDDETDTSHNAECPICFLVSVTGMLLSCVIVQSGRSAFADSHR